MSELAILGMDAEEAAPVPMSFWREVFDLALTAGVYAGLGVVALAAYCITAY